MKSFYIILFVVALLFSGCVPPKETFYWGNYSSTLYDFTKDPNEESLEAHKKEILLIFEYCEKKNLKIPPGISAEYGYVLLREGKESEGLSYLEKETTLYPESAIFINRIKSVFERGKQ